jgi:hypothetical protein
VLPKVCPETYPCTERRLGETGAWREGLNRLARALRDTPRRARRLGTEMVMPSPMLPPGKFGTYEEVFYTFPDPKMCPSPLDYSVDTEMVYDIRRFHQPLPGASLSFSCDDKFTYMITAGTQGKYCKYMNVPVPYNTDPAIVDNGCFRKCNALGFRMLNETMEEDIRYKDTMTAAGTNTWCSGNSPDFSMETNALCLPREDCEALCTKLGDGCTSFDMHAFLPRCYLNTPDCGAYSEDVGFVFGAKAEILPLADYDLVVKTATPSAAEDPTIATGDPARLVWTTYSGMDCTGYPEATHLLGSVSMDNRYACEAACLAEPDCVGFSLSWSFQVQEKRIAQIYVDGKPPYLGCQMYGPGFDPMGCTAGGSQLVMKTPAAPCSLVETLAGEVTSYVRLDEEYFLEPYNTSRVVYTSSMECDGWKVQDNMAEPIALTFVNCSDHIDAAKIWLPDYLAEEFADDWKEDWISRKPDLPCENMAQDELEYHIGQPVEALWTEITGQSDADNMPEGWGPCRWLIQNFSATVFNSTGTPVDFTTDLSTLLIQIWNGTGEFGNGTSTFQYLKDAAPFFNAHLVRPGTSICKICCGTMYKLGLQCPNSIRNNQTTPTSTNYTDWLFYYNEYLTPLPERVFQFPCQWGYEENLCMNPTFHGLCPHTCQTLDYLTIGDKTFSGQDLVLFGDTRETYKSSKNSTCEMDYDNNFAMYNFRIENVTWKTFYRHWPTDPMMACEQTVTMNRDICYTMEATPIIQALCPASCAMQPAPTTPAPPPIPDEGDPQGAASRSLYTTSYSGAYTTMFVEYYLPAESTEWRDTAYTWVNGSSSPGSAVTGAMWKADGTYIPGTNICPDLDGKTKDGKFLDKMAALSAPALYDPYLRPMAMSLIPVCRKLSVCPELSTCVLNEQRFQDEMKLWRGMSPSGAFLSTIDGPLRDPVLTSENFVPKVLLSADRAEALIKGTKVDFAHSIYRTVPLAMRVTPQEGSVFGDKMIISMVSAQDDAVASQEFGRTYPRISGMLQPWRGDILRIERFNMDGTPITTGVFRFILEVPDADLLGSDIIIYKYLPESLGDVDAGLTADITSEGGTITKLSAPNTWMVELTSVNADFLVTEDLNECLTANGLCQVGDGSSYTVDAICTNQVGVPPLCSCPHGYSGTGYSSRPPTLGTPCTLESLTYEAEGRPANEPPIDSQDY